MKLEIRDNSITDKVPPISLLVSYIPPPYAPLIILCIVQGIGFVVRLLRGQVKLVKSVPAEKRIMANFLSQVDAGDPTDAISVRSLEEIKRFCDVLAYINVATVCRRHHLDSGEPVRASDRLGCIMHI